MSTMSERMWALIRSNPELAADESQWVGQKQLGRKASRETTMNRFISSSRSHVDRII
jgi:hypothetical protein